MITREQVYAVLDGEREYQDRRWNVNTTPTEGQHTVTEWLVYMQDYVREAMTQVTRAADPAASRLALNTIRKITAMGVACMEQHGAPERQA